MNIFTTPFARNVLPRFGTWFYRVLEEEKPDYLVPVERKGAHLLDALLGHLNLHRGTPVRAPVLYRRAFRYLDAGSLDSAKVVLLDDATYTGKTLHDYRDAVKKCGDAHVTMLACIGVALQPKDPARARRADVKCFIESPRDEYYEYLWQSSELVVARGLTPEVDHHQFRLSVPSSLLRLWPRVLSALADYGVLDVHGWAGIDDGTHGATLHWPTFLPNDILPKQGVIQKDGVVKIRFFADFASDTVTAIPMVFPELRVPSPSEGGDSLEQCIGSWSGSSDPIVRLLLASSRSTSPDVVFEAVSLYCECVLMQSVCHVLREAMRDTPAFTATSDRTSLARLYGPHLGSTLADHLDARLSSTSLVSGYDLKAARARRSQSAEPPNIEHINEEVNGATDQLLTVLKQEYERRNEGRPRHEWETVGFGFADLRHLFPFKGRRDGALLLSRTIDLGCGTTGLVPYTTCDFTRDDEILVLRKYRTAENVRLGPTGMEDYRTYQKETSAEVVAAVAGFLTRRSIRWRKQPIPPFVHDKVIAILNGAAADAAERRVLVVLPKEHGPEAAFAITPLIGKLSYRLVRTVTSELYSVRPNGGIEPTTTFHERYHNGTLRISQRGELLRLEAYLQALVPVLDASKNVTKLLTCWSLSASGRLGLDYVMADVELALEALAKPVEVLAGKRKLVGRRLRRSCDQATHYLGVARSEKLVPLTETWANPVIEQWTDPVAVEADLLKSLAVPHGHSLFFSVAAGFIKAISYVADTLRLLSALAAVDEDQPSLFGVPDGQERAKLRSQVLERLTTACERLRVLRDEGSYPSLPRGEDGAQNADLANHFKRTFEILRSFASAFAGSYARLIDLRGPRALESRPRDRTILFADMADSTAAALQLPHDENVRLKNNGLNLIAQWAHAFGGAEGTYTRKGDDICLEFVDPECAILCAALVQEHLAALRSTGLSENAYSFRMALDATWITPADGGNRIGVGIDRAAKAAKADIPDEPEDKKPERIVLTPEVARACSERLRSFLSQSAHTLTVGEGEAGEFHPWRVDRNALISSYVARLMQL